MGVSQWAQCTPDRPIPVGQPVMTAVMITLITLYLHAEHEMHIQTHVSYFPLPV